MSGDAHQRRGGEEHSSVYSLLRGLRVVEAASFIAAPSCALHLAQMGAEVIRIDQIGGGPDYNRWPLAPGDGHSLYWEGLNKGKRSVAIDLGRPEGRELAARIITAPGPAAGLFVTNFPAGGFLAYDRLRAMRADVICLRLMGWGDGRPAMDYTVNAAIGIPAMTGPVEHEGPVNHVLPAWDLMAGAYAAFCIVSAERARRESGRGCEIRLPLSDVAITSVGHLGWIAEAQLSGDRQRLGNELFGAFGRDFETKDGQRLIVVAVTPRQWRGLVSMLGLGAAIAALETELGVSFDRDEGLRFEHRGRLYPMFAAAFAQREAAELIPGFEAAGVTWGPFQTMHEAVTRDPALSPANPVLSEVRSPSGERYLAAGAAATIPGATRQPPAPAPALGQDTDFVLSDLLGLSAGEIGRLHDAGLVASAKG